MKIEIRDSNPAVADPPLEVWLCPGPAGKGAVLMGHRGGTTATIARLTEGGLERCKVPEALGLERDDRGHVHAFWE